MLRYSSLFLALMISWVSPVSSAAEDSVLPVPEIFEAPLPASPEAHTKVAVIQWAPAGYAPFSQDPEVVGRYKLRTREALEEQIREAASNGAKFVVTPEFGLVGYPDIPELPDAEDNFRNREDIQPYVEEVPGATTDDFAALAKELGIYLHIGLAEVDAQTKAFYNTVVAIGPDGEIKASYRKMALFEKEHDFLSEGEVGVSYEAPFGRVGLLICADVYASEPLRTYAADGVDVLALSTSWAQMNTGWGYFTRAARSYRMFLLAANMPYFPDSGVLNPDGSTQAHIRQSRGIAYGYLPNKKRNSK